MKIIRTIVAVGLLVTLAACRVHQPRTAYLDDQKRGEFILKVANSDPRTWQVLCNTTQMRVALRNDDTNLYVQAIVWNDNSALLGQAPGKNKEIGDYSTLMVHFGNDEKRTGGRDVDVFLNPWPENPGIQLSRYTTADITKSFEKSPGGTGAIEYVQFQNRRIRVDRYQVPLAEIGLKPGAAFRTAFFLSSPQPALTLNSVGATEADEYFSYSIPVAMYKPVTLKAAH